MNKYFKMIANTKYISSWKSQGLWAETIKPTTASDNSLNPQLSYYGAKTRVWFDGNCLKQDEVTFNHGKVVNIYMVYEIIKVADLSGNNNRPTIENTLFGAVTLAKNADFDKYGHSG